MTRNIIIGSRGSELALWQANYVKDQLKSIGLSSTIKIIKTKGDQIQHLSFDKIEGKGFFTREIENELISNKIDLAVHSLKDLETNQPEGLCIAAVPPRENPADCLLIHSKGFDQKQDLNLKDYAVVGTSSARRKNQLLFFREDLQLRDLRGNVPTRVDKLRKGEYDAIVLAKAGLNRLNIDLKEFHVVDLSPHVFIPAPAQGALGLQVREEDDFLKEQLKKLNDATTSESVHFERAILNQLGGGCHSPFGAYSDLDHMGNRQIWTTSANEVNDIPTRCFGSNKIVEDIISKLNNNHPTFKVWISRELSNKTAFKRLIEKANGTITARSLISKEVVPLTSLPKTDWVFINSSFALDSIAIHIEKLKEKKWAAFGKATASYLQKVGVEPTFIGEGSPKQVAQQFFNKLGKDTVFIPSSNLSLGTVQELIPSSQKDVVTTYNTVYKKEKIPDQDCLVFTSPSNVEAYFFMNKYVNQKVVSIGPSTTKALKEKEVLNVVESYASTELALADMVLSVF
ncbi:MAG: hydroxymethylbilane synthase [Bacteroidota bacterium]|nr:hydroxymethylbilane synthase [Bacteroidota bacterium]